MNNKYTKSLKKEEVVRNWYEIDAEGKVVAKGLRGDELNEKISSLLKTSYKK